MVTFTFAALYFRSHEPVDRLIVDFLAKNAELVLQCLV